MGKAVTTCPHGHPRIPATVDFIFYILALFLLSIHLSHGFASVTQTLGINNRKISG